MTDALSTVVKFGGALLERPRRLRRIAAALAVAARSAPVVVVHGGGREVDADMHRLGIPKRAVDGLRITDADTLDVVLGVLAGRVNTRLVAAIGAAGGSAVGLTGVDGGLTRVRRARRYRSAGGRTVDLGLVGEPTGRGSVSLLRQLTEAGHVPVVASLGVDARGRVYNVNADMLAGDLAARLGAARLVIAGTTPGVRDGRGRTIPAADPACIDRLIHDGHAQAGMVAKLRACRAAWQAGVVDVSVVDGRRRAFLDAATAGRTQITGPGGGSPA